MSTETISTETLRPTRRISVIQLIVSLLLAVTAISGWVLDIRSLPIGLGVLAVLGFWASVRRLSARVQVSPAGVTFRHRTIAWDNVYQFAVVRRPWVRSLVVDDISAGEPKSYRLPAPVSSQLFVDPAFDRDVARLREWVGRRNNQAAAPTQDGFGTSATGFIMVAVFILAMSIFDRPLGWVSGAEASTTPSSCIALNDTLATKLGATVPRPVPVTTPMTSECAWTVGNGDALDVTYQRFVRLGLHSGADQAKYNNTLDRFGIRGVNGTAANIYNRPQAKTEPGVPGQVLVYPGGNLEVLLRKGNVAIDVQLGASGLDSASANVLGVTANAALAVVKLS